ncbi:MAG: hypothetical protein Q8P20_01840 [bacterium]|nr:hypothetical protein [bacterium]
MNNKKKDSKKNIKSLGPDSSLSESLQELRRNNGNSDENREEDKKDAE